LLDWGGLEPFIPGHIVINKSLCLGIFLEAGCVHDDACNNIWVNV